MTQFAQYWIDKSSAIKTSAKQVPLVELVDHLRQLYFPMYAIYFLQDSKVNHHE